MHFNVFCLVDRHVKCILMHSASDMKRETSHSENIWVYLLQHLCVFIIVFENVLGIEY